MVVTFLVVDTVAASWQLGGADFHDEREPELLGGQAKLGSGKRGVIESVCLHERLCSPTGRHSFDHRPRC